MHRPTLFLVFALLVASTTSCVEKPIEFVCLPDNLLLKSSSFPNDIWQETGSRDAQAVPSKLGIKRAGTSFSTQKDGGAIQDYYKFSNEVDARSNYVTIQSDWFNLSSKDTVPTTPEELDNIKLGADIYRLGCSQDGIETCRFVALYRTFVVEFKIDMPSLTYNQFIYFVEKIDQQMLLCINN